MSQRKPHHLLMRSMRLSFHEKVEMRTERIPFSACWHWTGKLDKDGYAVLGVTGGKHIRVARRIAENLFGCMDGLEVDHTCNQRDCVNPSHLEAVTKTINLLRRALRRTHCKRGHEYTPENLMKWQAKRGKRVCKTCCKLMKAIA